MPVQDDIHQIDVRLTKIETVLDRLEHNHLSHVEADVSELKVGMVKLNDKIFYGVVAVFFQAFLIALGVIAFMASLIWL